MEKLQKVHQNAISGLKHDQERAARVSEKRMNSSRARVEDLESKVCYNTRLLPDLRLQRNPHGQLSALRCAYTEQAQVMAEFHNKMSSRINNRPAGLDSPSSKSHIADDNNWALPGLDDAEILPHDTSNEHDPLESSGSITSRKSTPSPKRARTATGYRCSSPSAVAKTPLKEPRARRRTEGYRAKGRRHPLRALGSASQNEGPMIPTQPMTQKPELPYTSVSVATAQKVSIDNYEAALGDMSFNSSNILIGTSEERLGAIGNQDPETLDDETTTDI